MILSKKRSTKGLIRLRRLAVLRLCCSQPPKDRFSPIEAHIITELNHQIFDRSVDKFIRPLSGLKVTVGLFLPKGC